MMKKLMIFTLVVCMLLPLAGCVDKSFASDKAKAAARQGVETADAYLDGKTSYSSACDTIDDLYHSMDYAKDLPQGTEKEKQLQRADMSVSHHLMMLSHAILMDSIDATNESYSKIIDARNDLAADAEIKAR